MLRKIIVTLMIVIVAVMFSGVGVQAQDEKPIQLSLFTPIQIFPEATPIKGVRLSLLYGRSSYVTGLDWGLVSHTTSGTSKGLQIGLVGICDANFVGFQNNAVNIVKADFEGFQWGIVNSAKRCNGFQLGFVNYAETMHGLQIGLINIIKTGGQFPVFPFVNWSF